MKDIDKFMNLFKECGVKHQQIRPNSIDVQDGNKNDKWNYTPCFHCTFLFDDNGKYIDVDYGD